jgi:hypothetical protein
MGPKERGMSVLSALIKNPLDGEQKPWKPWYGYFFLAVLVVSGGLYVYQRVNGGPIVPTFTDPATVYENAKAARERQESAAAAEDEAVDAALSDVAKAALALIESTPIALPDTESFSGDAVELAAWIEQNDATLHATVIEDPSTEEIEAYLLQNVPVLVSVMSEEETRERWVVLDALSRDVVLTAMVGNRIVIVERA